MIRTTLLFLLLSLAGAAQAQQPSMIQWGIGGPSAISTEEQFNAAFAEMKKRGLTTYRFQINLSRDLAPVVARTRIALKVGAVYGIELKPLLMLPFAWEDKEDKPYEAKKSLDQIYKDAYQLTYTFVSTMRNDMRDWEMGNEINLRMRFDNGGKDLSAGARWRAQTFETPRMLAWSEALRGQADAIADINKANGTKLRRVLNTTMLQMGYLDFMQARGVNFEVISYHLYERQGAILAKTPNGLLQSADLFATLARYKKPIIINEINCAEIYEKAYENREGGRLNNECIRSLDSLLTQIQQQKVADIEGVQPYTLIDLPNARNKAEQEFGLMYDLTKPKLGMAVLATHAGGEVTSEEAGKLKALGVSR